MAIPLNPQLITVEKKYEDMVEFKRVFEKIRDIPRSPLTRGDYLDGTCKTSLKRRINLLSDDAIIDLFTRNGELIKAFGPGMFVEGGRSLESWDLDSLYEAYKGTERTPLCKHGHGVLGREDVVNIVRYSMHTVEEYLDKGCNLLLQHEHRPYHLLFFTTAIPARKTSFISYEGGEGGNVVRPLFREDK